MQGKAPHNSPFNILTALYSLTGLLSAEDVAEMFGKSPDTIYRMAQKRQIPSFMFGGSRCFDPSELAHWLIKKEPHLAVAARYFQTAPKPPTQTSMAGKLPRPCLSIRPCGSVGATQIEIDILVQTADRAVKRHYDRMAFLQPVLGAELTVQTH